MILNKSFNAMIFKYIYFPFFYVKPEQELLDNHNPNKPQETEEPCGITLRHAQPRHTFSIASVFHF